MLISNLPNPPTLSRSQYHSSVLLFLPRYGDCKISDVRGQEAWLRQEESANVVRTEEQWEPIDDFSTHVRPEYKGVPAGFKNAHLL